MQIEKRYHFYAGHRNKEAGEKCGRLHGHTYEVTCSFRFDFIEANSGVTMLFSDIDDKVEPIIKFYDHYLLLHEEDQLCDALDMLNEPYRKLPFVSSAENMAIWLANRIINETQLPLERIELAETKSSNVTYHPTRQ